MTGKLGSAKRLSTVNRLLSANSDDDSQEIHSKAKPVHLRDRDVKAIAHLLSVSEADVDRAAVAREKASAQREGRRVVWHSVDADRGKVTSANLVAWTNDSAFKADANIKDMNNVHFGRITCFLNVSIAKHDKLLAKIAVLDVTEYRFGGIWIIKENSLDHKTLPLHQISEPLISAKETECVAVLNSKLRVPSLEARTLLDHLNIT